MRHLSLLVQITNTPNQYPRDINSISQCTNERFIDLLYPLEWLSWNDGENEDISVHTHTGISRKTAIFILYVHIVIERQKYICESTYPIYICPAFRTRITYHSCGIYNVRGEVHSPEFDDLVMCVFNCWIIATVNSTTKLSWGNQ